MQKFLVEEPDERIALIRVFQHPWVLYFQHKFFANWEPNESESEGEGSSSDYEEDDDEEESTAEEDDDDEDLTPDHQTRLETPG